LCGSVANYNLFDLRGSRTQGSWSADYAKLIEASPVFHVVEWFCSFTERMQRDLQPS
jgi:hypothetical protein